MNVNYLQIEIGGKLRGLKFNTLTVSQFNKKVIPDDYIGSSAYSLIWAALFSNCYSKGVEVDFTFEEVQDWTEKMNAEDLQKVQVCFEGLFDFKKDEPATDEPIKKKQVNRKKKI